MKTAISFAAALAAFSIAALAPPVDADPPKEGKWKLVFSDDFDGKEVDGTKWEKVGDGNRRGAFWLKDNAVLDGQGHLVVKSTFDGTRYGCGGLRTRGKYSHSFGYYEIRCKVPQQPGTWSAFWLYDPAVGKVGNGGRDGAEIDIFESPWLGQSKYNIAVHWDGYGKEHRSWGRKIDAPKLDDGFHVFGLLWTKDTYVFYYDGKEVARTSEGGVCQVPLYLKVTTEIGEWAGDIKAAKLPDEFVVDWVKVYDRVDDSPKRFELSEADRARLIAAAEGALASWVKENPIDSEQISGAKVQAILIDDGSIHVVLEKDIGSKEPEGMHIAYFHVWFDWSFRVIRTERGPDAVS